MHNNPDKENKSALKVNEGIPQPSAINPNLKKHINTIKKKQYSIDEYVEGIIKNNRTILSKAITLLESKLPEHHQLSQEIISRIIPYTNNSIRIGITGVPGVGKSSFIEVFGKHLISSGHKLAVLAIDPSSELSKGSILGDKTRMEELSSSENAFIRPSPSAGTLGGVARRTRETVYLCEAAGYDVIFIETVGVGQSETAVHSMVDFFLLLALAGAGDELQGIKRGIMEMADGIVITKADGTNIDRSKRAKIEIENALHLFPLSESGWRPKVLLCSALQNTGIAEIWNMISEYIEYTKKTNYFYQNRNFQSKQWMHQTIKDLLNDKFYNDKIIKSHIKKMEKEVIEGKISSFDAAQKLINLYFKS